MIVIALIAFLLYSIDTFFLFDPRSLPLMIFATLGYVLDALVFCGACLGLFVTGMGGQETGQRISLTLFYLTAGAFLFSLVTEINWWHGLHIFG